MFKNIQLEVGSPQQFMDFQFRLDEPDYGEFWLAHCGALMDLENNGNDTVFPEFYPRTHIDFKVDITGPNSLRISIGDCAALAEEVKHNWFSQLSAAPHPALESIAAHVNPRARCHSVDDAGDARLAWDVVIDERNTPIQEPFEMKIARSSGGVNFKFERRRMPGVIARG